MTDIIEQVRENALKKFNETIEMSINTNIDGKKTDQSIKGAIRLPHDIGIKRIIVAITDEKNIDADKVGSDEIIQAIKDGTIGKIDRCVTTIDKIQQIRPISSILGKKGLMPSKKFNSLGEDIYELVENAKYDIYYRSEKNGIVHLVIGKLNMSNSEIIENMEFAIDHINKSFNDISITKVQNKIISAYLSTTQSKKAINITNFLKI